VWSRNYWCGNRITCNEGTLDCALFTQSLAMKKLALESWDFSRLHEVRICEYNTHRGILS